MKGEAATLSVRAQRCQSHYFSTTPHKVSFNSLVYVLCSVSPTRYKTLDSTLHCSIISVILWLFLFSVTSGYTGISVSLLQLNEDADSQEHHSRALFFHCINTLDDLTDIWAFFGWGGGHPKA